MTRIAAFLALLLLLQACVPSAPQPEEATTAGDKEQSPPAASMKSSQQTLQAEAVELEESSEALHFRYAWPAEAAAIPALNARLQAEAAALRQQALKAAQADRKERAPQGFPFHPHEAVKTWTVEGNTNALLALRGEFYTFTGGAHGMSGFDALLWDKGRDRDIAAIDLFADPKKAMALLKEAFCPALNAERAIRRGAPVPSPSGPDDWMNTCPDLARQVLIPSEAKNGAFTAIRVLIGPYEAGPYAEGTYDVALPVTRALADLVRPDYTGVVAAAR